MIIVRRITATDLAEFKAVRLHALQESPGAFGATYAAESQLTEADWLRRIERWSGGKGAGFLAFDDGVACGIAGILLDEKAATRATLVSMWTAPTHRRSGVGRNLVETVIDWARKHRVETLRLMVVGNNDPAIRLYERLGFVRTGRTEPYPNDPAVTEHEMVLKIEEKTSEAI